MLTVADIRADLAKVGDGLTWDEAVSRGVVTTADLQRTALHRHLAAAAWLALFSGQHADPIVYQQYFTWLEVRLWLQRNADALGYT